MLRLLKKSAFVAVAALALAGCAARNEGSREYRFCAVDDGGVPPPPTMRMVPPGQAAAYAPAGAPAPPPPPAARPVHKPKPSARPAPIERPAPAASVRPTVPPPPPESALAASRPSTTTPVEAGAGLMPVPRSSATAPSIMPVPNQQPPAMAPVVGPNADPTRPAIASQPSASAPPPATPRSMAQFAPRMPGYIEAENLRALLERAWSMVSIGNVRAARSLLTEAADRNILEALVALGETYDPAALARRQLRSNSVDPDKALEIYERAIAKGSDTARTNRDLLKAYLAEKKN